MVRTPDGLQAAKSVKLLGLFADEDMNFELDRNAQREPLLADMTCMVSWQTGFYWGTAGHITEPAGAWCHGTGCRLVQRVSGQQGFRPPSAYFDRHCTVAAWVSVSRSFIEPRAEAARTARQGWPFGIAIEFAAVANPLAPGQAREVIAHL